MVSVLFVCRSSHYKRMGLEVFDEQRDARSFRGPGPVIAHPPCRGWGRYAHLARASVDELHLARFAVSTVRQFGGVLEHPAYSKLWLDSGLPHPGFPSDSFGGWSFSVDQSWWGHRAPKPTWLYVVGCSPSDLPPVPFHLGTAPGRIESMGRAERERTPAEFAVWLAQLAEKCRHVAM